MAGRRSVFISYSSRDALVKNQLLEVFEAAGLDTDLVWHDRDTDIGAQFHDEILQSMEMASVAVLLVSNAFLASKYINKYELPRLTEKYEAGSLAFYPILLEKCRSTTGYKKLMESLQFACRNYPLKEQSARERSACLREIARDIRPRLMKPTKVNEKTQNPLPTYGSLLLGRDQRLKQLDIAWKREHRNIVSIIAEGGVGKTALISHWLARMDDNDRSAVPAGCVPVPRGNQKYYNGAERVFCFSFYSQGTQSQGRGPLGGIFLSEALQFFDDKNSAPTPEESNLKERIEAVERLAMLVGQQNALVVLDGLEPLQYSSGSRKGQLRDTAIAAFFEALMKSNEGLCVVTSRQELTDLTDTPSKRHLQINLENLSLDAGAELLERLGVTGSKAERRKAVKEYRGHALSLNLLGTYLNNACNGRVDRRVEMRLDRRAELRLMDPAIRLGAHAFKVMRSYQKWYRRNQNLAELNALSLMGLFDREATEVEVAALLKEPPIPGLTDALMSLDSVGRRLVFGSLREAKLLFQEQGPGNGLDAHPLVREYFGGELKKRNPAAWRAGHQRLYEHQLDQRPATPPPKHLEEMRPWLLAVLHGCQAGLPKSVYEDVYCRLIAPDKDRRFLRDTLGSVSTNTEILDLIRTAIAAEPRETLTHQQLAEILDHLSVDARMLGDLHDAIRWEREAVTIFGQMHMVERQVNALRHLAQYIVLNGNLKLARQVASEAVDKISDDVQIPVQVSARCTLANILFHLGQIEDASAEFQRAEADQAASDEIEADLLHRLNGFRFCELLLHQQQYDEVIRRVELTRNTSHNRNLGHLSAGLDDLVSGKALLRRGAAEDRTEAHKRLLSADRHLRQLAEFTHRPGSLLGLAEFHGDTDRAKELIDEAFEMARKHGIRRAIADARLERSRWLARRHRWKSAEKELATLEREVAQMYYFRLRPEIAAVRQLLRTSHRP